MIRRSARRASAAIAATGRLLALPARAVFPVLLFVAATLAPRPSFADWLVMPFLSLNFSGSTNIVDLEDAAEKTRVAYGGTVDWLSDGVLGFEVDFGYSPGFFERGVQPPLVVSSSMTTLMANGVIAAPRRWTGYSLRPYASGGYGAMRVSIKDVFSVLPIRTTLPAFNVGGGALGFVTDRVGVRWDIRYLRGSKADEQGVSFGSTRLSVWRASMALVLRY